MYLVGRCIVYFVFNLKGRLADRQEWCTCCNPKLVVIILVIIDWLMKYFVIYKEEIEIAQVFCTLV